MCAGHLASGVVGVEQSRTLAAARRRVLYALNTYREKRRSLVPTDWMIGYIIGVAVVIIVAVLALVLIAQARKIGSQATDILEALRQSRDHTEGLWDVDKINRSLDEVRLAAREARLLAGGGGS